jgi:hypothetical protein
MVNEPKPAYQNRWSMRWRDFGVAAWVAFLAASVGTFVLFGILDPGEIESAWMQEWEVSRKLAYSIGFLFLFVMSLIASGLTVFMIRTGPQPGHVQGKGKRPIPEIRDPAENNPDLDLEELR